ncbi:MAG: hypothetical protein ACOYYS_19225 [Chloroflexota bacterium]
MTTTPAPVRQMIFEDNPDPLTACLGEAWKVTIVRTDGTQETATRQRLPDREKVHAAGFYATYRAGRITYKRQAPPKGQPIPPTWGMDWQIAAEM